MCIPVIFTAILSGKRNGEASQRETSSSTDQGASPLSEINTPTTDNCSETPTTPSTAGEPTSAELANEVLSSTEPNASISMCEVSSDIQETDSAVQSAARSSCTGRDQDLPNTPLVAFSTDYGESLSGSLSTNHPTLSESAPLASDTVCMQNGTSNEPIYSMANSSSSASHNVLTCDDAAADNPSFLGTETMSSTALSLMQKSGVKVSVSGSADWSGSHQPTSLPGMYRGSGSTASGLQNQDPLLTTGCSSPSHYNTAGNDGAKAATPAARHSVRSLDTGRSNCFPGLTHQAVGRVSSHPGLDASAPIFAEDPITLAEILEEEEEQWGYLDSHLLPMTIHGNRHCPSAPQAAPEQPLFTRPSTRDSLHSSPAVSPLTPQPQQSQPTTLYQWINLPPTPAQLQPYHHHHHHHPPAPPFYNHSASWPLVGYPGAGMHSNFHSLSSFPPSPANGHRNAVENFVTQNRPYYQLP